VRSLRLAPFVLAAAVLLTSACGGDPSAEPSPSASPSTRPSPTQAVPLKPHTPIAFVKAWVEASTRALNTGDLSNLRSLVSPECLNCRRMMNAIRVVYSNGGHIDTKGIGLANAHLIGVGTAKKPVLSITIITYPQTIRRSGGATPNHTQQGQGGFTFWLERENGSYLLTRMDPVT
jgi:hypothetical protein